MNERPTLTELDSEKPSARDIYEVAWLPAVFAIITAAATWLIWYYTNTSCTPELMERTGCNPATIARYINVDIFGRMLTYSAITAATGGVWNYNMFTKMRAQIAAERQRADAAINQLEEYRRQVEEERRQERETFMTALAEERQRADEERQRADEERSQAAEERAMFRTTLTEMLAQVTQLVERQNGNGPGGR